MKASAAPFVPGAEGEEDESGEQQNSDGLTDPTGASMKAPDPSEVAATNIDVSKPPSAKAPAPDEVPPPAAAVVEDKPKEAAAATAPAAGTASKECSLASSTIPPQLARGAKATHLFNASNVWRPTYRGRIRSFSDVKGFGFIDCQDTLQAFGNDVFIHRYQMAEGGLKVGQHVKFEVELNPKGQPQARRVQIDDGGNHSWSQPFGDLSFLKSGQGKWGTPFGKGSNATNTPEDIEEKLRTCSSTNDMWELIEQFGHSFQQKHVVTALYSLGLCRQNERQANHRGLTRALVDRLVLFAPRDLSADEASKVLWALAILDEDTAAKAHNFAMQLAEEATTRYHEFSPARMATFINALSRLIRSSDEDELVGKITINFSDYAMGIGANPMPRFPAEELRQWKNFLMEASSGGQQMQGRQGFPFGSPLVSPPIMMGAAMPKAGWRNGGMPVWGNQPPMQRPPGRVPMNPMMGGPPNAMHMWQGGPGKGGKGSMLFGMMGADEYQTGPASRGGGGHQGGFPGMVGGGCFPPAHAGVGQSKGALQMGSGPGPGMGGGSMPAAGFGGPGDHQFFDSGGKKGDGKEPQNFERRKGAKDKGGGKGSGFGAKDGAKGKGPPNGGSKAAESKGDAGRGKNVEGKGDAGQPNGGSKAAESKGDAGRGKNAEGKGDAGPENQKSYPAAGGGKGKRDAAMSGQNPGGKSKAAPSPPPPAFELRAREA